MSKESVKVTVSNQQKDIHDFMRIFTGLGESLQAAADAAPSAMVSVIGLDADKVAELCEAANAEVSEEERVQIANFLCPVYKKTSLLSTSCFFPSSSSLTCN